VGGAMNISSGIFTAPVTGKYFFSYTGTALFPQAGYRINLNLSMMKNGNSYENMIAASHADSISSTDVHFETFSMIATQNLVKGDRIWVEAYAPNLADGVKMFFGLATQFNGFLLEEDISQSIKLL
jgi:hypothetical protein